MNDKKVKQPYGWYGGSFNGLAGRASEPQYPWNESLVQIKALMLFHFLKAERGKNATEEKLEAQQSWSVKFKERRKALL